jgi:CubicO group peptidase (beta-lactamase class C family)
MRPSLIFILVSMFLVNTNNKAQQTKTVALEKLFSYLQQNKWFNGAVVAGRNGRIIFSKGYGYADFSDSTYFTPSTPSDGGSNAKTLTAASILLLAESGKLNLKDPVQQYLPAYPYSNTTIFNLITHSTGGLPDYDFYFEKISDSVVLDNQTVVDVLQRTQPHLPYKPNENFFYDSPGFDLAATIVERVSGLTYQQFLGTHFFRPLNMTNSFVRPALLAKWPGRRTKGYRFQNDSLKFFDIVDREGFYGGSNVWISATDLYKWGTGFYHHPTLSAAIIKKITSSVLINNRPSAVRLGAWYQGRNKNAFYYWGDLFGFYSWVYWDKKQKFTIAFVSNTSTPPWLRPQLTSALIDIMEGKQVANIERPATESLQKNQYEKITGFYQVNNYGNIEIYLKDSLPVLRLPSQMEYKMVQVGKDIFYVPGLEPWISFRSESEGKFGEIIWSATTLQTMGKRINN